MKSIVIAGNIGKDAVIRTTQNGKKVAGWSVGVTDGWGDRKTTLWFDCSWWGQRGENTAQYLTKGTKVCVSGDLSTREHEGKTYLTVDVQDVSLMGSKPQDQGQTGGQKGPSGGRDMDDEIEF